MTSAVLTDVGVALSLGDVPVPVSADDNLYEAFASHAVRTPDAVAVVVGGERATYAELAGRAEDLAEELWRLGVRRGRIVPIRLPKSVDLIASLLAVLRLGAVYAMFDREWPADRVRRLTEMIGAGFLIGDSPEPSASAGRLRCWYPPAPAAAERPPASREAQPAHCAAYTVYFTSGTTGAPKGVLAPHDGIFHLIGDGAPLTLERGAVITQSLALPWDFAGLEIWSALATGGTLVLVQDAFLTPGALRELVVAEGVNVVHLSTSLFRMIAETDPGCFHGVRRIVVGGEALLANHCERVLERYPDVDLVNSYGPVEVGVFATTHRVTMADCERGVIPIGMPVPGTLVEIEPLESSKPNYGELVLGGSAVTLQLITPKTSDRARLILGDGGSRRYRTGDLVRVGTDGLLHFCGRVDREIKVSGVRVSPEEVEQLVATTAGLAACSVQSYIDRDHVRRGLWLFYAGSESRSPAEVRASLSERMPAYQVPDRYTVVDALPLTRNGKVDARRLLSLGERQREAAGLDRPDEERIQPESPTMQAVRRAVGDVLMSPTSFDARQSWSDLEARSLDLARIASAVEARLNLRVPLPLMYSVAGPAQLASELEAGGGEPSGQITAPGVRQAITSAQAHFFAEQLLHPESLDHNFTVSWNVSGDVDTTILAAAFAFLHERYDSLRARFDGLGAGGMRAVASPPPALVDERAEDLEAAIEVMARLVRIPFAPRRGELWFPFIVRYGRAEAIVGLSIHHLAIDGGSLRTVADDLSDAYWQLQRGVTPSLAPSPDLAAIGAVTGPLGSRGQGGDGGPRWAELMKLAPVDLAAGAPSDVRGVRCDTMTVSPAIRENVERLASQLNATPFNVFLAVFALAIASGCALEEFAVVTAMSHRGSPTVQRAVACLISFACVVLRVDVESTVSEIVTANATAVSGGLGTSASWFTDNARRDAEACQQRARLIFLLQDDMYSEVTLGAAHGVGLPEVHGGLVADLMMEAIPRYDGSVMFVASSRAGQVAPSTTALVLQKMRATLQSL